MIISVHSCHQHKRTLREWHLNSGCYSIHPADCRESWFGSDLSQQTYTLRGIISYLSAVCTANFSRYCHFSEPPAVSLLVPCTFLKLLIIRRLLQTIKPPYGLRRLLQTYSIWYSTKQKEELHSDSSLCEYKRSIAVITILVNLAFSATCFGSTNHHPALLYKTLQIFCLYSVTWRTHIILQAQHWTSVHTIYVSTSEWIKSTHSPRICIQFLQKSTLWNIQLLFKRNRILLNYVH